VVHPCSSELNSLSEKVLAAVFEVSTTLGAGFLEEVYPRALLRELGIHGLRPTAEHSIDYLVVDQVERAVPSTEDTQKL
jgi:GxxExxY protein